MTSNRKLKAGIVGGLAALLLGGAVFGTALAQPAPPGRPGHERQAERGQWFDTFVQKLASKLGTNEQNLRNALVATQQEMVDDATQAGRLTPDQATKLKERIQQSGGRPFSHAPRGGGERFGQLRATFASAAEQALGLSPEQLQAHFKAGKSIADIAREQGKDPAVVRAQLLAALNARIDDAVKSGRLSAERAAQMKARLEQHADRLMNHKPSQDGPQRGQGEQPRRTDNRRGQQ
jgi:uncharacterized protein YidB (DUF937 family)